MPELVVSSNIWHDVMAQGAVETEVICQYQRHLEHMVLEGGVTHTELMQEMQRDHRTEETSMAVLDGMLQLVLTDEAHIFVGRSRGWVKI